MSAPERTSTGAIRAPRPCLECRREDAIGFTHDFKKFRPLRSNEETGLFPFPDLGVLPFSVRAKIRKELSLMLEKSTQGGNSKLSWQRIAKPIFCQIHQLVPRLTSLELNHPLSIKIPKNH